MPETRELTVAELDTLFQRLGPAEWEEFRAAVDELVHRYREQPGPEVEDRCWDALNQFLTGLSRRVERLAGGREGRGELALQS